MDEMYLLRSKSARHLVNLFISTGAVVFSQYVEMERAEICGLKGVGSGTRAHRLIPLEKKKRVIIGRGKECDVVVQSPFISRQHAILEQTDGRWTITDNQSINGVTVNGTPLVPLEPHRLMDSDSIQLGIHKDQTFELVWIFSTKLRVKVQRPKERSSHVHFKSSDEKVDEGEHQRMTKHHLRGDEFVPAEKKSREESQNLSEIQQVQDTAENKGLTAAEIQIKMLETEIEKCRTEKEMQKESLMQLKENITGLVESNLQCDICTEMFVKATILNCSHVFCAMCIEKWMRVQKVCPMCRAPITSKNHVSRLDDCIDLLVDSLSADMKNRREQCIEEHRKFELANSSRKRKRSSTAANRPVTRSQQQFEVTPGTSRILTRSATAQSRNVPQHR